MLITQLKMKFYSKKYKEYCPRCTSLMGITYINEYKNYTVYECPRCKAFLETSEIKYNK